ncbi:unnamed protein product [Heligmosomoides polygyrus]|uniref:Methionine synthase reductase n=1 Tax=Heligmosomoides polygyrus TaxID=6339 RepID=A0A3P8BVG3_HELPZ|nr:unnamed protein product [Heligmosomoides polygyrus]
MAESGDFLILYGSHTGQAESISKQIKERAELLGLRPRIYTLNENEKEVRLYCLLVISQMVSPTWTGRSFDRFSVMWEMCFHSMLHFHIENETLAVIVVSSTGDGDPPENASRFVRRISRKSLEPTFLQKLEYALLGLGDSNYSTFQGVPTKIDQQLRFLGATPVIETGHADDQVGFSGNDKLTNEPGLRVPVAPQEFLATTVSHEKLQQNHGIPWQNEAKMVGVASAPYDVTVVGTARLTDADVVKPKYELVVILEHFDVLPYEPGDAFYFVVENPLPEVNFILERMGLLAIADQVCTVALNPSTQKVNPVIPAHVPVRSSLRHLFTHCLDIRRTPGRPILRALAEGATNEQEKRRLLELTSAQGLSEFNEFVRQPGLSLSDILFAFPSVRPSAERLIELLPRLTPRSYSASSCRGRRVRFIYSVMSFTVEDGRRYPRKGLATDWLLTLKVDDKIQQQNFRNLKLSDAKNFPDVPRYLYFGCRNLDRDALYIDELKSYVREGILKELILCESQGNGEHPKYVQDSLKQRKEEVCEFLSNSSTDVPSRIFICGDAKGMSKDVLQCFHEIVKEGMGKC